MDTEDILHTLRIAVASIQVESAAVQAAMQEHSSAVSRATEVAREVLGDYLETCPQDMTRLTLPEGVAAYLVEIWAAKYAWSERASGWHKFAPFVNMLLGGTNWYVDDHNTTEPNPHVPDDNRVIVPLNRFGAR